MAWQDLLYYCELHFRMVRLVQLPDDKAPCEAHGVTTPKHHFACCPACRITTANNRMFAAADAAPAGEAEAMGGLQLSPLVPDTAGKAGALLSVAGQEPVNPGTTFTAAEPVAAGIMMGGAGSSAPAHAGQAAAMAGGQQSAVADMQVD
jgi:hypothetical protein